MKKVNLFSVGMIAIGLYLASCNSGEQANTAPAADTVAVVQEVALKVDTAQSVVMWKGEMLKMYSHEGNLKLNEGSLTLKDGKVVGGNFVVNMKTMVPTDQNYDAKKGNTSDKLVQHLSAKDFFAVDSFPTASFSITGVDEAGNAKGTLTVRGKNGEETVNNVVVTEENGSYKISGDIKFNRKNYNVMYSNPAKEMILSDDVNLKVNIVATATM